MAHECRRRDADDCARPILHSHSAANRLGALAEPLDPEPETDDGGTAVVGRRRHGNSIVVVGEQAPCRRRDTEDGEVIA